MTVDVRWTGGRTLISADTATLDASLTSNGYTVLTSTVFTDLTTSRTLTTNIQAVLLTFSEVNGQLTGDGVVSGDVQTFKNAIAALNLKNPTIVETTRPTSFITRDKFADY